VIIARAEVVNKPLNGSLAFVTSNDVYIKVTIGKIVVHFGFMEYEEVVTQLRIEYWNSKKFLNLQLLRQNCNILKRH
jgi:hypothetical protein